MNHLFAEYGAHVLVDGQYGSTGKGLFAAYLAEKAKAQKVQFAGVVSNAGPNSGHTFYHNGVKIVLKQLPSFAVKQYLMGNTRIPVYLDAGAIINPTQLREEALAYPGLLITVHPCAAVITEEDREAELNGTVAAVAGTRSGTGAALARKVLRDPKAVWGNAGSIIHQMPNDVRTGVWDFKDIAGNRYFFEVSQGFSLGLNDAKFYPKVTSRECTVMQAISDARLAPRWVTKTYLVARTFPIRVGNVDGFSSGDYYPDQQETDWQALGVEAELTTVTKRVRRVFTFSVQQLIDSIWANQPDWVLLNFLNYLPQSQHRDMVNLLDHISFQTSVPFSKLYGFGPLCSDIVPF